MGHKCTSGDVTATSGDLTGEVGAAFRDRSPAVYRSFTSPAHPDSRNRVS